MVFPEFKTLLQRYHHPNNNNRLWENFLTRSNLAVVKEVIIRVSNKLRAFLHSHEILQSVKPFSTHWIQIKFKSFCRMVTGFTLASFSSGTFMDPNYLTKKVRIPDEFDGVDIISAKKYGEIPKRIRPVNDHHWLSHVAHLIYHNPQNVPKNHDYCSTPAISESSDSWFYSNFQKFRSWNS